MKPGVLQRAIVSNIGFPFLHIILFDCCKSDRMTNIRHYLLELKGFNDSSDIGFINRIDV
jgi:hypothetical protein